MRFVAVLLLALQCDLTIGGHEKEHVHFKIYVPEIIKHHIHTKTVFIHVYDPKTKKVAAPKKNEHVESHREDWNIWGSYNGYNEEQGDRHDGGHRVAVKTHSGQPLHNLSPHHPGILNPQSYVTPYDGLLTSSGPPVEPIDSAYPAFYRPRLEAPHYDDYRANYQSVVDHQPDVRGSLPPKSSVFANGVTGYSYPPQYAVRENVIEDGPESPPVNFRDSHEEGHSERLHSETGHLYTNELSDFYDENNEESREALSLESREVEESKNRDGYRYVGDQYLTTRMTIR